MHARVQSNSDRFWRALFLALCTLVTVMLLAQIIDLFGLGGPPWGGYWDAQTEQARAPFSQTFSDVSVGGPAARAGIRNGDVVDLREADLYARASVVNQPVTFKPVRLLIHRDGRVIPITMHPGNVYEGPQTAGQVFVAAAAIAGRLLALICAWIIVLQRSMSVEARFFAGLLLATAVSSNIATPLPWFSFVQVALGAVAVFLTGFLPAALAVRLPRPPLVLRCLFVVWVIAVGWDTLRSILTLLGTSTLAFDPNLPLLSFALFPYLYYPAGALALAIAVIGILARPLAQRARFAWMLLPVSIVVPVQGLLVYFTSQLLPHDLFVRLAVGNSIYVLAVVIVTYAVVNRRVLDLQFVINRALVFTGISVIVVASFVLLEWVLGAVLEHGSRDAGTVANAGLALVLGLSMRFIHRRVDHAVDRLFFRKRHEDEQALRDFAKEAAYVTERDALLDHTIAKLHEHTDASSAAVLLDGDGRYHPARWFGESEPQAADENDEAILAMKAHRKPIDPHDYATELRGDLALPMLVRGELVGTLVCGVRARGEAYAPDEVEALSAFAHGIGTALDAVKRSEPQQQRDDAIANELLALRATVERLEAQLHPVS